MGTKTATPATKGAILTLLLLLVGLAIYFGGQVADRRIFYVLYVILFVGVMLSSLYYSKQMNGNVSFGNVFAEGFKTTAVIIVLSSVCTFISLKFIFPGLVDKLIEIGKAEMKKQGGSSNDEINKYFDGMKGFMVPLIIGYIIFFFGIIGAIGAATRSMRPVDITRITTEGQMRTSAPISERVSSFCS